MQELSSSVPAAVWLRVSTTEQESSNQIPDVERFCAHHGYEIAATFTVDGSAWKNGNGGSEYGRTLQTALDDAWRGECKVLVVWALDRITRLGAEDALRLIRQFRERECTIVSVMESWLNGSPEITDVLVAFARWMAEQESARRSERIPACNAAGVQAATARRCRAEAQAAQDRRSVRQW